jgi:hypothetical protein
LSHKYASRYRRSDCNHIRLCVQQLVLLSRKVRSWPWLLITAAESVKFRSSLIRSFEPGFVMRLSAATAARSCQVGQTPWVAGSGCKATTDFS